MTYFTPGNYCFGFSRYLNAKGLRNVGNASFTPNILGTQVVTTAINSSSVGQNWGTLSGVAQIQPAGWYDTPFVYNSNRSPSTNIVIDRVFVTRTLDAATVLIPNSTITVHEPGTWAILALGFGFVGAAARRHRPTGNMARVTA